MLLFVMSSVIAVGQESYEKLLREYCSLTNSTSQLLDSVKSKALLQELNKMVLSGEDLKRADQLAEEYLKTQFQDDLFHHVFMPMYQETVSEQDFRELVTLLKTKEGKQWNTHNETTFQVMVFAMSFSAISFMLNDDEKLEEEAIDSECPKSFQNLFDQYYESSRNDQILNTTFQMMLPSVLEEKSVNKKGKEMIEKFLNYFKNNMKVMMLNSAYKIMTEDDLKFGINMFQKPSYQKVIDATMNGMTDKQKIGVAMVTAYVGWLHDEKGITLKTEP